MQTMFLLMISMTLILVYNDKFRRVGMKAKFLFYLYKELQKLIYEGNNIVEFVGRIKDESYSDLEICLVSILDAGVFIGVTMDEREYLSLKDKELLTELIDVWGDELNVSRGLFVSVDEALNALDIILENHKLCDLLNWITPEEMPEDSNYII